MNQRSFTTKLLGLCVGLSLFWGPGTTTTNAQEQRCPDETVVLTANVALVDEDISLARSLRDEYPACTSQLSLSYVLARLDFLEGNYEGALSRIERLDRASLHAPWDRAIAGLYNLVVQTADLTQGYAQFKDPKGTFIVRYPRGKDEVLVPYIRSSFPKMIQSISKILNYSPDHPVRIEIYESPDGLARATGLTEEEIETSGTIALCKYRKLMITSPKALVHGYGWLDTLAHEYVHYAVQRLSGNKVPIWLHEAFAKYLESRWRSPHSLPMNPSSQHRLRNALRKRSLISFDEMSPSMAKLPSKEHTALAFAEVYTVGQFLETSIGPESFRALVDSMANGDTDKEALAKVSGSSYRRFLKKWRRFLRKQKWRSVPAGLLDVVSFKNRKEPRENLSSIGEKVAEDFTYLGDMLRARDRTLAATKEYRKASERTHGVNPVIQGKLAGALLDLGSPDAAYAEVQKALVHYPDDFMLQRNRGRAARALGKKDEAMDALNAALRKNPFDVEIHRILAELAEEQGAKERAQTEREALRLLMTH